MQLKKDQSLPIDINTLDLLPIAVAIFDNKKVYFVNKKAKELFHISKTQSLKINDSTIFNFLDKKFHTRIKQNNIKIIKGKEFPPVELEFKTLKNKPIFIEAKSNRILIENKYVVQSSFIDITERVNTENVLKQTKERFDLITRNSNDIIAMFTYLPKEKYTYVSPNIKTILGYAPEELLNDSNFFNKRVISNKEEFLKIDKIVKADHKKNIKKTYYYTYKTLKKNNEEIWLENNLTSITGADGKIIFFLNILRDITIQKEKEIELQSQHINYRNLLDSSPIAYIIHKQGVTVFCNKAMLKLLQLKNEKQILGKFVLDYLAEEDRMRAMDRIKEIYNGVDNEKSNNYTVVDSKGNLIETEMKSIVIKFNHSTCILTLINNITDQRRYEKEKLKAEMIKVNNEFLLLEIKERQEAEKKLLEKTAHLSSIFESSDHLIWTINNKYEVTSFNKNFYNVILQKHKIKIQVGQKVADHLKQGKEDYIKYWYPKYHEAFSGKKIEFEKEDFSFQKIHRKIYINPIFDALKNVTEVNCIAHDISDSKLYEQKLLNQTSKIQAIFDSSHHYIWTINQDHKLTSFNKNYFELVSVLYNTKPFLGFKLDRGVLSNNQEYAGVLDYHYDKAFKGIATNFEIETLDKDHKKIYLDIFLSPIIENEKIVEVSGIAHDITEKKIAHQRVEQSLKEKDVLLKEVHHRVKNNMQIISSILNLQSSYVTDKYTLSLLKESQNRIKTMAYIHESLYQNKSFTSVNFSDYIQTLAKNIIQSYVISSEKIELILNLEKINLNLDISIPAGLIINELITNAIKHAFPEQKKGAIYLNLKSENNYIYLEVIDNGIGIPAGIDYNNTNTLGLQLVNTLIDQLDGEIKFKSENNKGTEVLIKFRM